MASTCSDVIEAAGGVVTRKRQNDVEVLLVHRPKYDDWTLPKGKLDEGEKAKAAALREVEEETGYRCTLGDKVGAVSYTDRNDRPKRVRYWAMDVVDGSFSPNREVDQIEWLTLEDAIVRLSYLHDRELLSSVANSLD